MGAICPKGKTSAARRDKRRANSFRIPGATLSKCPKCSALIKPHRACRSCGSYNNREVLAIE